MRVRVGLLEVVEVGTSRLKQAVDIEHMDARLSVLERHPLLREGRAKQVCETDAGRTRAEEEIFFVLEFGALEFGGVDHASERDARGALDIVVVNAIFVAVALEQVEGVHAGPILEVNAAFRENLLHGLHEFIDEGEEIIL